MKGSFRKIALEWMEKAESDLNYARASFEEFDKFYSQMCILSHDAAEKYLKGYIAFCGIKPEKIHDVAALLNDCIKLSANKEGFIVLEEKCRILNQYYIPLKYPSHYPMITREQAKQAIESAAAIEKFIKSFINRQG